MEPSSQKSYCIDLFTLIFLAITCFAEDASATDIESMLSSRSESRVTKGTLNECKLVIEASYPQNINAEGHKPDGVRKAVKTVWIIDLSTVGSVKVAPVCARRYARWFLAAKKNLGLKALGACKQSRLR